jgi:3-oxoacid CoA-transferase
LLGGFGLCGIPENLISAMIHHNLKDLTVSISNGASSDFGLALLLKNRLVKKVITTHINENTELLNQYLSGDIELELTPQGTLAEKLRAGGAGIKGFYTPTGVGTMVEFGGFPIRVASNGKPEILSKRKENKTFDGDS